MDYFYKRLHPMSWMYSCYWTASLLVSIYCIGVATERPFLLYSKSSIKNQIVCVKQQLFFWFRWMTKALPEIQLIRFPFTIRIYLSQLAPQRNDISNELCLSVDSFNCIYPLFTPRKSHWDINPLFLVFVSIWLI